MRIVFVDNIQPPKQNKFHRNSTCPTWTCWILLTRWSLRIPGVVSVPFWRFLNITSKWQCFRPCLPNWLSCQRRNDCRFVENQFFIFTCLSDMLSPFFPQPTAIGIKQDSPVCFFQVLWHQRHPGRLPKMDEATKTQFDDFPNMFPLKLWLPNQIRILGGYCG
jgi:hypothetical protein